MKSSHAVTEGEGRRESEWTAQGVYQLIGYRQDPAIAQGGREAGRQGGREARL